LKFPKNGISRNESGYYILTNLLTTLFKAFCTPFRLLMLSSPSSGALTH
jgi:hypothetical protein